MPHEISPASANVRPKRENSKPGRVDFNTAEFDNAIEDQGSFVRITPAVLCPNRTSLHDTNHQLGCPICNDDGVVDLHDKAVEEWALITSLKLTKQFEVPGIFDLKDAQITVKPHVKLYYFYKVEVLDFGSVFNQLIKRGVGENDKLRYRPFPTEDIPYYLVDATGVKYEKGTDYEVEDQKVKWLSAHRPGPSKLYSISYPVNPTFRILELLHDNRYYYRSFKLQNKVPVQLPQQAVMRLDYISKGSGSNIEK
jgi:hypothetical protein